MPAAPMARFQSHPGNAGHFIWIGGSARKTGKNMRYLSTLEPLERRRLLSNADLDPTFGHSGLVGVDLGRHGGFDAMLVQTDGRILAAGRITSPSRRTSDALLARFNANGSFDTSFGQGGIARLDRAGNESFRGLALRDDGSIIAGGDLTTDRYMLAAFDSDGLLDTTFGGDGVVEVAGRFAALALQSDKIVSAAVFDRLHRHDGYL